MRKITVHIICNAHIDPIWLWPWSSGLDEILNTSDSVCNLLDRHPDVIFTQGEAWAYEQIERMDSSLFQRIKGHVKAGRWEITGGWYIQPDCNLPSDFAFKKQIELGQNYFRRTFGQFPKVAYNIDSFGHSSSLPDLMAAAGQTSYVMQRPNEENMTLPARLFRWRGRINGSEIVTFRLAGSYCTSTGVTREHVEKSLTDLPPGINHTMCFVGMGDHGGGPNEEIVQWCGEHRDAFAGARLEFSSPSRFFRAVHRDKHLLPLVTGELQHFAIGCYTVHRPVKVGVRRAEHLLAQAEESLRLDPELAKTAARDLKTGWRWVCFNQFHDTLGGTCLPSAYDQVDAQLGLARAVADETLQLTLRRRARKLPPDVRHRLVIGQFSGGDFDGWIEHEPWLDATDWQPHWCLLDEKGKTVPYQFMEGEAVLGGQPRLLFKLKIKRDELRVLRLSKRATAPPAKPTSAAFTLKRSAAGKLQLAAKGGNWNAPSLELIEDKTDTWGQGIASFAGKKVATAKWRAPRHFNAGPLMHAWAVEGGIGHSTLAAEWRRYVDEAFDELRLEVNWQERHRLLRLIWQPGGTIQYREDGVSHEGLRRESDRRERPVRDRTLLHLSGGKTAGIVSPHIFSLSATPREVRLTLLRSPIMAHLSPFHGKKDRLVFSDQGVHSFLIRFYWRGRITAGLLEKDALALNRKPLVTDATLGMPRRPLWGQLEPLL